MTEDAGMAHLQCYLDQVRRYLKALPPAEAEEVIAELRAHVLDKVDGSVTPQRVEAAIEALGSPREMARINLTERVTAEVARDRSPLTVLRGVARLAGLSLYGFFAGLVSLTGYSLAGAFAVVAVLKPFAPGLVGMWYDPAGGPHGAFAIGVMTAHPQVRELLGWWIIPIGVVAAAGFGFLTWRFGLFSLWLMGRRARRH